MKYICQGLAPCPEILAKAAWLSGAKLISIHWNSEMKVSSDKCFHHSITFMWMTPPAPPHGPNAHFHSILWIFNEFIQAELDYIILHMKWDLSIPLQFLFILQLFRREVSFQESAVQFETLILARRRPWGRIAELWQGAAQLFTEKQSAPNSIW